MLSIAASEQEWHQLVTASHHSERLLLLLPLKPTIAPYTQHRSLCSAALPPS